MNQYEKVTSSIQFNNHVQRVKDLFNEYFHQSNVSFTKEDIIVALSYIPISEDIKKQILSHYNDIIDDQEALDSLSFIRIITVEKAHPSEWLLNKEPEFSTENISKGIFSIYSLLVIAIYQINLYKKSKIDEEHITFNLSHLQGFINEFYVKENKIGINNYTWCIYLSSLGLIHLHTLHFMHHVFSEKCIIFKSKNTQKVIMLALGGIDVRIDGQINKVNGIDKYNFTTIFKETNTSYIGHRVNPYGSITNDVQILSKVEYEVMLKPGDFVIDFHIPTGKGYTIENTKESFLQAMNFFKKIYPEYDYKAFWCLSWLSSPQIPLFLNNPYSNIYKINEESYTFPATNDQSSILKFVFGDEKINLNHMTPQSSLERGIINYTTRKNKINCGVFLYLINDLNYFGTTIYRTEEDYTEFVKLNKNSNHKDSSY